MIKGDLVRTADKRKIISKVGTTNWSYELHKITEVIIDTIPSYHMNKLPERYNKALLKKTELSMKENM